MKTRNVGTPKTPPSQKKSPATKKPAAKTTPTPPPPAEESTPGSSATPASQFTTEPAKAATVDAAAAVPTANAAAPKKKVIKTRKVIRKVLRPKAKASSEAAVAVGGAENGKGDQDQKGDDAKTEESLKAKEVVLKELGIQRAEELGDAQAKGETRMNVDDLSTADTGVNSEAKSPVTEGASNSDSATVVDARIESLATEGASKSAVKPSESMEAQEDVKCEEPIEEIGDAAEKLESEVETQVQLDNMDDDQKLENMDDEHKPENMDADQTEKAGDESVEVKQDDAPVSEGIEDYDDEECFVEPGEEELRDDDEPETNDEMKALDEEQKELAAAAKERKIRKEHEIFVGGLDREVVEEDVKKVFEKAGEVVEVRLLKDPTTNKNRGFAFVRFGTKDQAKKALSEMKNPMICGKRCGTAANEDNDTLFVGNICNTWTKEAIKQKLKDYDVEGAESITLVQDPRHEGLSRGFCFIQFACHADAMFAYKRLQKPDAVFGHAERTAKVAFAEPLPEPDPEVMAKVKSVFVDGLPPFWDEDRVRKHFNCYGEIERVTLARNMSSAKRKDFGFVDYKSHETAIACIEDVNKKELVDGNSKTKVRARLSNPLPKLQAVKGGMCGGFRIGRPTGRTLGRPGPPVNRPNFHYGRVLRGPFNDPVGPYGQRFPHRGGHGAPGLGAPGRPNFGGPRHGLIDRGPARPIPPHREPFPLDDGGYSRPFMGRHYDDPYMYDDGHGHGLKRPFYLTEQDLAYMEPTRVHTRYDYTGAGRGSHFRDTFGAGSSSYSSGYYGADYGARPYPDFNSRDRTYGSSSSRGSGSGSGYYY